MNPRILLVDDDEIILSGLAEGLDREGFDTLRAASGAQALTLFTRESPDLVLTDIVMDEMDGLQLMRRIREWKPDFPVIVITGHGSAENAIEALRQGASDYIQKPARVQEIAHRIRGVLDAIGLRRKLSSLQNQKQRDADRRSAQTERTQALRAIASGLAARMAPALDGVRRAALNLARGIRSDDPLREDVQAVERNTAHLDSCASHLRRLAHPPAVQTEDLDLSALLRKYLASDAHTQRLHRHTPVRFTAGLPETALPVAASTDSLARLLTLLLDAAFFALPRGGRVWLDARAGSGAPGEPRLPEKDTAFAQLTVGFSNPLDAEQLSCAFDPFCFLPELPNAADFGFALSDAKAYAESLHADLRIRALPKEGAEFILRLALRIAAPARAALSPEPVPIRKNAEVLVVDDQDGMRAEARSLLTELGYQVREAATGRQAVDFVRERGQPNRSQVHLVLLDLVLGEEMDGVEAARAMLDLDPGLRILLAGGFVETDRVTEARQMGVLGYLRKPFAKEALARAVRDALEEREA